MTAGGMNKEFRITVIEIKFMVVDVGIAIDRFGMNIATRSLQVSELARVP